jgi:hypothetical protein
LRPTETDLLAVPISRLYDCGQTVLPSEALLQAHIGEACLLIHPDTAERFHLKAGGIASALIHGISYKIKVTVDEKVPASITFLPRSMGIPSQTPAVIRLKAA